MKGEDPTFRDELKIVLSHLFRSSQREWRERLPMWGLHISKYVELDDETKKKLEHLWKHLDAVDGKISRLLQFLGAFSITTLLTSIHATLNVRLGWVPESAAFSLWRWAFVALALGLFVSWMCSTLLCLSASREVVWGDLSKHESGKEIEEFTEAVVERTAKFRIASGVTWGSVCLAFALMTMILVAQIVGKDNDKSTDQGNSEERSSETGAIPVVKSFRRYNVGPFPSGAMCGPFRGFEDQLTAAADKFVKDENDTGGRQNSRRSSGNKKPTRISIVGFADGVPVRGSSSEYVDNAELAEKRARCVEERLRSVFAKEGLRIEMEVGIDDDIGRMRGAAAISNPDSRHVMITWPGYE